jgi:hypothetical protein
MTVLPQGKIRVTDTSVVFQENDPASPTRYSAAPCLFRCSDGLLLTERVGTHKNSADGTQRFWRSTDLGRTWQRQPFPFDRTPTGKPGEFRTVAFSEIDPGRTAMLLTWMDHPPGDLPLVNQKTEGLLPIHIAWSDSLDGGRTWKELRHIPVAPLTQPCGNGPTVRLPNGFLLAGFETYKPYDDPSPWSARSACTISHDDGRTWQSPRVLAQDPEHQVSYWDHHLLVLQDGTLLDMLWADDRRKPGVSELCAITSHDSGTTWSHPRPIGISGQYSNILQLHDGRLMMFYVVRSGDPSIRVRFGSGDGKCWDEQDAGVVHSNASDDLARTREGSFGDYLQDMGAWTFGWPSAVQLSDAEVLVAYYKANGPFSVTRLARVQIG